MRLQSHLTTHVGFCILRLKYTIILKWSFLIDHVKIDLLKWPCILQKTWWFNPLSFWYEKVEHIHWTYILNMFNFLHIKMMKIPFEIIRRHCVVLATTRNLHTCVYFYVNICLNENKNFVKQNLNIVFEYWKI